MVKINKNKMTFVYTNTKVFFEKLKVYLDIEDIEKTEFNAELNRKTYNDFLIDASKEPTIQNITELSRLGITLKFVIKDELPNKIIDIIK